MTEYMNLPPPMTPDKDILLPVGTRILFIRELSDGPDEFSPGNLYAEKDSYGRVTGHGCREGHWVKWDRWDAPFGAEHGKDFVKAAEKSE